MKRRRGKELLLFFFFTIRSILRVSRGPFGLITCHDVNPTIERKTERSEEKTISETVDIRHPSSLAGRDFCPRVFHSPQKFPQQCHEDVYTRVLIRLYVDMHTDQAANLAIVDSRRESQSTDLCKCLRL